MNFDLDDSVPSLADLIGHLAAEREETVAISRCHSCQALIIGSGAGRHARCQPWALEPLLRLQEGQITYKKDRQRPLRELKSLLASDELIQLGVLFGSRARGDERPLSDVDLLVDWDDETVAETRGPLARIRLMSHLSDAVGLEVQVATLSQARRQAIFLARILAEGVVLLDRISAWPKLKAEEEAICQEAEHEETELMRQVRAALEELDSQKRPSD